MLDKAIESRWRGREPLSSTQAALPAKGEVKEALLTQGGNLTTRARMRKMSQKVVEAMAAKDPVSFTQGDNPTNNPRRRRRRSQTVQTTATSGVASWSALSL